MAAVSQLQVLMAADASAAPPPFLAVYAQSGRTASDVDVIELHDCFSTNELLTCVTADSAPTRDTRRNVR